MQTSDLCLSFSVPPRNTEHRLIPSAPVSRRMTLSQRRHSDDIHQNAATSFRNQMMGQRLMLMLQKLGSHAGSHNSLQSSQCHRQLTDQDGKNGKPRVENYGFDGITTTLSAMYAKVK